MLAAAQKVRQGFCHPQTVNISQEDSNQSLHFITLLQDNLHVLLAAQQQDTCRSKLLHVFLFDRPEVFIFHGNLDFCRNSFQHCGSATLSKTASNGAKEQTVTIDKNQQIGTLPGSNR